MNGNVSRIIDIVGTALILGLVLRWGPEMARLITTSGTEASKFFRTVSLQDVTAPADRV